jgi:hypothetical protein
VTHKKGKGKAKKKNKKKEKKSKRKEKDLMPTLGVKVNNLKKPNERKAEKCQTSGRFDVSRLEQTLLGFRSGGYPELMHGRATASRAGSRKTAETRDQRSTATVGSKSGHSKSETTCCGSTGRGGGNRPPPNDDSSEPEESSNEEGTDNSSSVSDSDSNKLGDSDSNSSSDNNCCKHKLKLMLKKLKRQNKQLEQRITTQARSGYKAQAPKAFNGSNPDFDKFEQFVFNYDSCARD